MVFIEKHEFTYQDYLNYCNSLDFFSVSKKHLCVQEENVEYTLEEEKNKKTGDKKHDKIFKEILQKPKEMAKFINKIEAEVIKLMKKGKGEEVMSTIQERISAEIRNGKRIAKKEGRAEGRAEGRIEGIAEGMLQGVAQAINQTIERMIKMNLKNEIIIQATGAKDEEIEKVRKAIEK